MTDPAGTLEHHEDAAELRARHLRYAIYAMLMTTALGSIVGRILAVNSVNEIKLESYRINTRLKADRAKYAAAGLEGDELEARVAKRKAELDEKLRLQRPFLSSNDRSRWAATRALVELGTFEIDKIIEEPGWDTIDKVQHKGADGKLHLYSSKPPILSVLMAVPYYAITKTTGMTLATHPYTVARIMLILINGSAMLLLMVFAAKMAERWGPSDWSKVFVVAAACWGTYLNTFAVVINNHVVAAACAMVAIFATLRIWRDDERTFGYAAAAGFFATLTVAHELPALSLWCVLGFAILCRTPKWFIAGFLPAAAMIAFFFFGANKLAHDSLRPPYMHRGVGQKLFELPWAHRLELEGQDVTREMRMAFDDAGLKLSEACKIEPYDTSVKGDKSSDRLVWLLTDQQELNRYPIVEKDGRLTVHRWDNWYDYEYTRGGRVRQSYWRNRENRSKIDQGEASRATYALHVLVGHHGIFSLTPVWLLSMVGIVLLLRHSDADMRWTAVAVGVLTVVCIAFYIARPLGDRNYGGMTSGFRWMFWFAPLWLWTMLPAADLAGRHKFCRVVAILLVGLSVMSAAFPTWNPWTQPWMYQYLESLGRL